MTTTTTHVPDLRPLLGRAMEQTGALIAAVPAQRHHGPTPCHEYDVTQLVHHLQAVVRRIGVVLAGEPFWSVPREIASTDWEADWAQGRQDTERVLADDEALVRIVTVPWGQVSGAAAVGSYVGELAVHAWDLATAIGAQELLDDELAVAALPAYQEKVPAQPRGGDIPFGPVVEVGDGATPYERLVAWTGRDPHWTP